MAQCEVDPSNLKSFQRISQADVRYLTALGQAMAFARSCNEADKVECKEKSKPTKFDLAQTLTKSVQRLKVAIDKLLYETVPTQEVYASRD